MSTADAPAPRGWLRRYRVPIIAVMVPVIARLVMLFMERTEIGLEFYFGTLMAFQFLTMFSVLTLAVWFVFFSGFRFAVRAAGVLIAACAVAAAVGTIRKIEFDGKMNPTVRFKWEPTDEQILASHLSSAPAAQDGAVFTIGATDSPCYRGPSGNGLAPGVTLAGDWTATPPKELWRHPVGTGHAGIAVAGNSAVTIEQREGDEVVVCYDRATGRERWAYAYPARFSQSEPMGGDGPRTTPAIADGDVYSLGARGDLVCLDGSIGSPRWKVNVIADNGAAIIDWGVSASPVVVGGLVVVNPGIDPKQNANQAVAAYDRKSGKKVWANGSKPAAYASPQRVVFGGKEQVLVFDAAGLGGYDLADGAELWRHPWKTSMNMNSAQPVVVGPDRVFVSSELSNGGAVVEVRYDDAEKKWQAREVWHTRALCARFACPVVHNGYIYGLSGGLLVCVDAKTGKQVWNDGKYGDGQIVLSGDYLVISAEKPGRVVLVAADPSEFRELGSMPVFKDRTWNVPALAGNQLFMRNHREMACLELPTVK
ncbi:PQQ-binding-like beta-propeller repeat protein [Fimbriiglobus ruber]|uniref:Pyrrolo-quinoline quinone repeat domain-containing protein n=1 Tax=Fimbriiglobus ruber TaxID=1908690 RepID=A0A225E0R0_9BACT|nr:PQQ-binding-like beta-propeller repeat protein [Fimbriiglobus ruber]OWK47172.1 hypothetical protein FRUB_00871 [Fimbriiglobus ruber]